MRYLGKILTFKYSLFAYLHILVNFYNFLTIKNAPLFEQWSIFVLIIEVISCFQQVFSGTCRGI